MKRKMLLQAAILVLSGCVSVALAQAGGSGGSGGGQGGGQAGAGNATTGSAGGGGANTTKTAPDSNLPGGVQGTASQKTDASGMHPIGTPQSDATGTGHTREMKGCIEKSGNDFFLANGKGRRMMLQPGATDLSAHVGHEVKIHGTVENGAAASMGTTGETTGTTGKHDKHGDRMMTVDKIDMVSETCPASTGAGNSGTTTPPPQQ
jgi:hypothetical protein